MTLNYLLYFCTPAKISIIFKYEHITPKKWMRLVKPKKALGQHFLKDLQIAQRIADTLDTFKQLPVLEIGPGMGVLTQFLLEKGHDLTVVELDMESVDYLEQNFPVLEGKILAEDFLRLDLGKLFPDQFCVIGNYPYNISSQIFFKVLITAECIQIDKYWISFYLSRILNAQVVRVCEHGHDLLLDFFFGVGQIDAVS